MKLSEKPATWTSSETGRRRPGSCLLPARTDPGSVSARRPAPSRVPGPGARTSRLRSAQRGGGAAGRGGPIGRAGTRARAPRGGARRPRPPRPSLAPRPRRRASGAEVGALAREKRPPRAQPIVLVPPAARWPSSPPWSPADAKQVLCGLDAVTAQSGNSRSLFSEEDSCSGRGARTPRSTRGRAGTTRRCCGGENRCELGSRPGRGALGCGAAEQPCYSALGSQGSEMDILYFSGPRTAFTY